MSLLDSGSMMSIISIATLKSMHPPPDLHIPDTVKTDIAPTLIGLLFVDFTKLTPASKAEKAIR
jgi:hypothetical protein